MAGNYFSGMSGGWLGGWIIEKYNQLSPQLGWVGAWAELGKNDICGPRPRKKIDVF